MSNSGRKTRDGRQSGQQLPPNEPTHRDEAEAIAGFGRWSWAAGTGLACSAGLLRMLERTGTPGERDLLRRLSRRERHHLLEAVRQAHLGTTPDPVELHHTDARGDLRNLSVTCRPDAAGAVWGVCQDVTTQRRIAAALGRSETRWETALATARQGVWDSDIESGVVYHSRTWRTMRGMNSDGDPEDDHEVWADRVHPDDLPRVMQQIADQHAGHVHHVISEYRERHRNGEYIWISSQGAPVAWFANGKPSRILGTDTDITDRKRAEQDMLRLSRRLQISLEVSRIGVFEANLATGELFWDMRCREMYGLPTEGEIGRTEWVTFLHPDDAAGAIERVGRAVEAQSSYTSEFRIIRLDGEIRIIRTQGTWYRDSLGIPRMVGANWDVTEEVAAKQDLERAKNLAEARNVELEEAKAHIEHHALHDALTGLPNRRYLDKVLSEHAAEARNGGVGIGLLHIDLDRFKQINDTLGHIAGDAMLIHVARLLREFTGSDDFVARVGGDEFVVVCRFGGDRARLSRLASTLIERMRRPVPYQGHHCRFGASIGIATQVGTAVDPARLLIDADIALYLAKARGKNGFQFFTEQLQAQAISTKNTADDILAGVELDQFLPFYQPVYDASTMQLTAVEALARWQHPQRGLLLPSAFLKIAEDLNVVTAIDSAILDKALTDMRRWGAAGLVVPAMSVNVSFRRLSDEHLVDSLRGLTFAPGTLSFELLESIFLDDVDEVVRFNLDRIRDHGIELSIDDFGTGHASILSLLKLRPNRLKIDRQFLDDLCVSDSQQRLVGSLIDIGRSLGIKVVAEGVESLAQAEILRRLGVDSLQGFAFARPMPASQLESLLGRAPALRAS